ncbi:2-dehydro-3-deoxygluconokinase [Cognatishimia activa]|uniref:2-dehydro-3-deoxygluconokinase n=1 Tax=Cognatishimia activa TaxID=1715691 RepID=A0A0P1J0X2_9RHOB|nr:sugar kinase [Cognatishimia activa]CUK27495.1 2-dehydro-3-deoxygluconokinase [Cognatishimia activa]
MSKTFLSIGECMVEVAPAANPTGGTDRHQVGFAGDTFNTAWYAARLLGADWKVSYFTGVGTDQISSQFLEFCRTSGVDTSHIYKSAEATLGLYMVHLKDGERSFSYWRGKSAAKAMMDEPALLKTAVETTDVIYLSGITVAILHQQGRENLLSVLTAAKQAGKQIIFDPNLRPKLWQSVQEMVATVKQFASVATVALPSFDDERDHFGDVDLAATGERYRGYGCLEVVVKNGADEILAFDNASGFIEFHPTPVQRPTDTTAAGDSFNAGYISARLGGSTVREALALGSAVASEVVCGRGALVDLSLDMVGMVHAPDNTNSEG